MAGSKKKVKPAFMTIRQFWTRSPVTRVKQDDKKEAARKECRKKPAAKPKNGADV
ncbi:MAG: hypothetical protein WCX65_04975 [bacterium]